MGRFPSRPQVADHASAAARQIETKSSALRLAPPISPPSTSGRSKIARAFFALTEPP
jgi:hypothetical protein